MWKWKELLAKNLRAQVSEVDRQDRWRRSGQQNTPNLTQAEKEAWCQYFYIQWCRVPEVRDQIVAEIVPEEWEISNVSRDLDSIRKM